LAEAANPADIERMSAVELIEQIRALPEEERAKVVRFVIEHEESWIPTDLREAMEDAAQGKMVDMERVMTGEKSPGAIRAPSEPPHGIREPMKTIQIGHLS
jgi:hypothetical protein